MSKRNFNRHIQQQIQMASFSTMLPNPKLHNISPTISKGKSINMQSPSVISEQSEDIADIPLICNISNTNFTESINFSNKDDDDNYKKPKLVDSLKKIISNYNVSHNFVNELLLILRQEGLDLPKDARVLLNTPKHQNIMHINPGSYIHLGIKAMMFPILKTFISDFCNTSIIKLSLNIDGLPIAKSSKACFWTILISIINNTKLSKLIIPVGIYHDKYKKPDCISEFLSPFVTEMNDLITNGFYINKQKFTFEISQIICDAPAKAFILNVKQFNAYHGCNSCTEEGTFLNRITFLGMDSELRTDKFFREKTDVDYNKGNSPLLNFKIDISLSVVLDYMHNVCLGVMKRMLQFWLRGPKTVRLNKVDIDIISSELINLKKTFPAEFSRLPRSLEEVEFWKATEYRSFLLYTGPIVLKGRLKKKFYEHFITIHTAICLLASNDTCLTFNDMATTLIRKFVNDYSILHGDEFITYNVHSLIHLSNFVKHHGPLDSFSAFKFENYLQFVKKSLKNAKFPLQDIYNRIIEHRELQIQSVKNNCYPILKNEIHKYDTFYLYNPFIIYNLL